jgi:hypothetical protein
MEGSPPLGWFFVRHGYVPEDDGAHRVPRWSAWRVLPEYLDPPTRRGG